MSIVFGDSYVFMLFPFLSNIQTQVKFPAPHVFGMLDFTFSKYDFSSFSVIKFVIPFDREIENNTHETLQKLVKSATRVKSSSNVGQPTGMFSIDSEKGLVLMINRRRLIKAFVQEGSNDSPL